MDWIQVYTMKLVLMHIVVAKDGVRLSIEAGEDYLFAADCVSCPGVAGTRIRCTSLKEDGSHTVYQGCFLGYDVKNLYKQSI